MAVIAMTREMGSLGQEVAEGVARALGLRVVYHEVIDHVAERMNRPRSAVTRFLECGPGRFKRWHADNTGLDLYTAEEILDLAYVGNVIIRGWGATCLLQPVLHVPRVRVCAPMAVRIRRIMERLGSDDRDYVEGEIRRSDAGHAAIVARLTGAGWEDPTLYDLVLNTERDPLQLCIDEIVGMARSAQFEETEQSRRTLANLALRARIRAALHHNPDTRQVNVNVDVADGVVTLDGMVEDEGERRAAELLLARIEGVAAVRNCLKPIQGAHYHIAPLGSA